MAGKSKSDKAEKLTREQELLQEGEHINSLWMDFRKCFRIAFSKRPIEPEEEQKFLTIKSDLARTQRVLAQKLPQGFRYGGKRISEIMGSAVSIATLRDMPVSDKKTLYARWHEAYIALQSMLGVLDVMNEGYKVTFEQAKAGTGNLKESLGLGGTKKKKKMKDVVVFLVVAVVAAVALYYFFMRQ